ncbi:MAG: response regulator [Bdellovibrionota bacterium]
MEIEPNLNSVRPKLDKYSPKSGAKADKASVKVFVVEDEPTTIILTEAMLSQLGYIPAGVATSFEAAIAAIKKTAVDIVLVDIVLSGSKTGFDVIKELNRLNIPCVLISGSINETTLNKLADLDVYGFLPKPYDQLALATVIQLALKKFTRMQDRIFDEADAIKSRILASQALETEFGVTEKLYLIKKEISTHTHNKEGFTYHHATQWLVRICMLLVGLACFGYLFGVPFLLMYGSHAATMKANVALCIVLLCFSLSVENSLRATKGWRVASVFSLATVISICGLTLLQYIFLTDFGIDEFLLLDRYTNEFNLPGRMAMPTALTAIALAIALLSNRFKNYRYSASLTEGFALIALSMAMVGIFGHLFKQIEFNRVIPYLAQSHASLIALVLLSLGVFFLNPKNGLMSIFSSQRVSAKLGRKMLYWVNTSMILISLLIYYFIPQSEFKNLEVIFTLITSIIILTAVILWSTRKQIKNELQTEQTVKLLENRERELQFVLKRVPYPVAVLDKEMCYVLVSRKWSEDFCLKNRSIIGHSIYETFPQLSEQVLLWHKRALGGEIVKMSDENIVDFLGQKMNIKGEIRPWFDINDQVAGIIIFFENVTFLT